MGGRGGNNDPCLPPEHLAIIEEKYHRPCPRVEIEPENLFVREMVGLTLNPRFETFMALYWEANTNEMTTSERRVRLDRLIRVMSTDAYRALAPAPRNPLGL